MYACNRHSWNRGVLSPSRQGSKSHVSWANEKWFGLFAVQMKCAWRSLKYKNCKAWNYHVCVHKHHSRYKCINKQICSYLQVSYNPLGIKHMKIHHCPVIIVLMVSLSRRKVLVIAQLYWCQNILEVPLNHICKSYIIYLSMYVHNLYHCTVLDLLSRTWFEGNVFLSLLCKWKYYPTVAEIFSSGWWSKNECCTECDVFYFSPTSPLVAFWLTVEILNFENRINLCQFI